MHIVILPGNSKEFNEQWLFDSEKNYKDLFESATTHYYKHWELEEDKIYLDDEVEKLSKEAENLGKYIILAKSIGTLVTLKTISDKKIKPVKCVFVGSPWNIDEIDELEEILKDFRIPTLFVQQTNDMFFKHKDLEKFLEEHEIGEYQLVEIPGENHAYDNYDDIKKMIKDFVFN